MMWKEILRNKKLFSRQALKYFDKKGYYTLPPLHKFSSTGLQFALLILMKPYYCTSL